jgi:hypothetical protein
MGRDYMPHDIPFLLWSTGSGGQAKDLRLEANWWEPEENEYWGPVNEWEPQGEGEILGETEWKKGEHVVEVCYGCLVTRSETFFAAKDLASLEAWKRDHAIEGAILENEQVVLKG